MTMRHRYVLGKQITIKLSNSCPEFLEENATKENSRIIAPRRETTAIQPVNNLRGWPQPSS